MANHFENHMEISKKGELFKNLKHLFEVFFSSSDCLQVNQENIFSAMPLTFSVKIALEKQNNSMKQQLESFRAVNRLLDEFKQFFDPTQTDTYQALERAD